MVISNNFKELISDIDDGLRNKKCDVNAEKNRK